MDKRLRILIVLVFLVVELTQTHSISGQRPVDCGDIGSGRSGVYAIYPKGSADPLKVFCFMQNDEAGWTVIQRRMDGSSNFYRNWIDYEDGFGNLQKEFWLGNFNIHILTAQGRYELWIQLEDFENNSRYAKYTTFMVGDASSKYKLLVDGYHGNAGDSFGYSSGMSFSAKDQDNDVKNTNCAVEYKGAWWYRSCHYANLNGLYLDGSHSSYADGVNWHHWKGYHYSLKATSMMIRRRPLHYDLIMKPYK